MADEPISSGRFYVLLNAIRYRYRLIIGVAATALVIAAAYIISMPNVYRSQTQILVNPQRVSDKYVSSTVSMDPSERLGTLSQQILSSSRLELILNEYHLFPSLRGKVSRDELLDRMRKNIGIELKHNSDGLSSFTLSYTGDSATEVAAVANRLADLFISWNLHDREQEVEGTTQFLANELSTTKQQLDGLEEQLRAYKMRHLGELPDQLQVNLQTLSRLQVQLQANNEAQNRLDHEALLTSTLASDFTGQRANAVPMTPRQRLNIQKAQAQSDLADLRKQYTENFPDVVSKEAEIRAIDAKIASLPSGPAKEDMEENALSPSLELIRRDRERLVKEQRAIRSSIDAYQARIDSAPIREQEISQLLRDYDTARDHYRSLLEKTYQAQMAAQLERDRQGGSFTMLDRARIPDAPIGPKRVPLLLGAFFLACAGGFAAAFARELMDESVKSESDLRTAYRRCHSWALLPTSGEFLWCAAL